MGMTKTGSVQKPDVAITVKLKGRATAQGVSEAVGYDASAVLDELATEGVVEPVKAFFKITPLGVDTVLASLAAVRGEIGDAELTSAYEAFCAINDRFKATVTDWQLRPVDGTQAINDHSDAVYDAGVLDRLGDVHTDIVGLLGRLPDSSPRYSRYRDRLDTSLQRLRGGELQFMASPAVDSYHSIWLELHEELILLCGLTRAGEAEAGRG